MEEISIRLVIRLSAALTAGRTQYGDMTYCPSVGELGQLTPEERGALAPFIDQYQTSQLHVTSATWPEVMTALRAHMVEAAEETAKAASLSEQRIIALLATTDLADVWVRHGNSVTEGVRLAALTSTERKDPRVADFLAGTESARLYLLAARDAELAVASDAEVAEHAAKDAAKAVLIAWASERSVRIRTGIAAGYDMDSAVQELLCEVLAEQYGGQWGDRWAEGIQGDYRDRQSPSMAALTLERGLDEKMASCGIPAIELSSCGIKRVHRHGESPRTVVLYSCDTPFGQLLGVFDAEEEEDSEEEGEE